MAEAYSEEYLTHVAKSLRETIDMAVTGIVGWDALPETIGLSFPGVFAAIRNEDLHDDQVHFLSAYNLDPEFAASYAQHYASINPWNEFWKYASSGEILISEDKMPAKSFNDTEFYNDWLKPQKTFDAGAGLSLTATDRDMVYVAVHFEPEHNDVYGPAFQALYESIREPLKRAIRLSRALSNKVMDVAAQGALVERFDRCAIVVDEDLTIRDANPYALDAFENGCAFSSRNGRLRLKSTTWHDTLASNIRAICLGLPSACDEFTFIADGETWLINLATIRISNSEGLAWLVPPKTQVLVLARNLSAMTFSARVERYARFHRLSDVETALCERLVEGDSLVEAAGRLAVKESTARQRLKGIFQKTETNRQSELVAAIMRFN